MWIAILVLGLILFVVHAIYFSRRIARALAVVAPRTQRWHRPARRVYLAVACSGPVLLVASIVYGLIAQRDTIGPPDSALYAALVEMPFWFVTIYSFQVTLLVLPLDLLHLAAARLGVAAGQRWAWRRHAAVLAIAAVFLVLVPVRLAQDGRRLEVRAHEVTLAALPAPLDGLEVALIADLHADAVTDEGRLARLVDAVNREQPDLVVIAGDMITRAPRHMEVAARMAGTLRARLGVLACVGDHENFAYRDRERSVREMRDAMARHGVPMLDNQVRTIDAGGGATIAVVLATSNYVSRVGRETTARLLEEARPADLRILCAHQASRPLLAAAAAGGIDVFLAGHTHGGQVSFWLPFYDLTPARFESSFLTGAFHIGPMTLVVTSGFGMSVTPFRYRAPATVDLIRFRRAPDR